jgi:hypothetical protein
MAPASNINPGTMRTRRNIALLGGSVAFLVLLTIIVSRTMVDSRTTDPQIATAAHQFVSAKIGPMAEIRFGTPDETHVEKLGEGKFLVTGSVQAVTRIGQTFAYDYNCIVVIAPEGLAAEKVELIERWI